jgi:hypothetical protein
MSGNQCPHCGARDDAIEMVGYCGRCGKDVRRSGDAEPLHPTAGLPGAGVTVAGPDHPWRSWLAAGILCLVVFALLAVLGVWSGALGGPRQPQAVSPADLRGATHVAQLASDYVTIGVAGAVEIGYQYRREGEGRRATAKLMAIPVNDRLLIVLAPLDHREVAFTGVVREMPSDVQLAVLEADLRGSLERLKESQARWKHAGPGGPANDPDPGERPSLKDLCLPLVLDATSSGPYGLFERVGLVVLMGLFLVVGCLCIRKALRLRSSGSAGHG